MPAGKHWVVTGKLTEDGANVWRRADGGWSLQLAEAEALADEAAAKQHTAHAVAHEQRLISDPYVIEVKVVDGTIEPLSARERIRSTGPTVRIRRPDSGLGR